MGSSTRLSFEDFVVRVGSELRLGAVADHWGRDSSINDDLGLDSLQMVALVALMDDLGAELPEDMVQHVQTLDDLYDHYRRRRSP